MKRLTLALVLVTFIVLMLPAAASANFYGYNYSYNYNSYDDKSYVSASLQQGPNYQIAHKLGSITFQKSYKDSWWYEYFCGSGSQSTEKVDLEGISNLSTSMLNVLDINVTSQSYKQMSSVQLSIGLTGDFPNGSKYIVTEVKLPTQSDVSSWLPFSSSQSTSLNFTFSLSPGQTATFYLSFYLPPSSNYVGSSAMLWYQAG